MALACARRHIVAGAGAQARFFHCKPYQAKVGAVEFLNGAGKGAEAHATKLEEAVSGDIQRLLEARKNVMDKPKLELVRPKRRVPRHVLMKKFILSFPHKNRRGI